MSLHSYYTNAKRKDLAERAIVREREKEATRVRKCEEIATYHRNLALSSAKYRDLEEETNFLRTQRVNEESSMREKIVFEKKEKLENRRRQLAHLLAIENEQYMKELKERANTERETDSYSICRLKETINDLQRKREEGKANMQKRYMHHLWDCSSPCIKESEEMRLQKEVTEALNQRKEECAKLNLARKEQEIEDEKALEMRRLKAIQEAQEAEAQKLQEREKWAQVMDQKINKINDLRVEVKRLQEEDIILSDHMETVMSVKNKREQVRDIQGKGAARISSLWQPKEKLRKMAVEIQHALEAELKVLKFLGSLNANSEERALLNLSVVERAQDHINMQIGVEKQRVFDLAQLFHEEATKVWENRKLEWAEETASRNKIMDNVFESLLEQISNCITKKIEEQKELKCMEESCLKEIDEVNMKSKEIGEDLDEKEQLYWDRARRYEEELQSHLRTKKTAL